MADEEELVKFSRWCNKGVQLFGRPPKPSLRDGTADSVDFEVDFERLPAKADLTRRQRIELESKLGVEAATLLHAPPLAR